MAGPPDCRRMPGQTSSGSPLRSAELLLRVPPDLRAAGSLHACKGLGSTLALATSGCNPPPPSAAGRQTPRLINVQYTDGVRV